MGYEAQPLLSVIASDRSGEVREMTRNKIEEVFNNKKNDLFIHALLKLKALMLSVSKLK
jgi:hypothetical protein